ncbi:hypothetical protein K438DRAFT_1972393 [Mycena galopus ATCC 62051]|nr:hypothetical protein K438DRAFT_1972393 [Mycena galopus ATCC 62051]
MPTISFLLTVLMDDIVNSALFDSYWEVALRTIAGAYAPFTTLLQNFDQIPHRKNVLLNFSWAMAALGTTQVILRISMTVETLRLVQELVKQRTNVNPSPMPAPQLWTYYGLDFPATVVLITNNLTVDLLFVQRSPISLEIEKRLIVFLAVPLLRDMGTAKESINSAWGTHYIDRW